MRIIGIGKGVPFRMGGNWLNKLTPEFRNVYNAMTNKPSYDESLILDEFVSRLVEGGVWNKLDILNFRGIASNDNGDAQINWITGQKTIELSNNPTFIPYLGFLGNGTNSYIKTNYNPASSGNKYSLNDACMFVYKTKVGAIGKADFGIYLSSNTAAYCASYVGSGLAYCRFNNLSTSSGGALNNLGGLILFNRRSSSSFEIWSGKTLSATKTINSVAVPNGMVAELVANLSSSGYNPDPSGYSSSQHLIFGAGASLTNAEIEILNNAIEYYIKEYIRSQTYVKIAPYQGAGVCIGFDDSSRCDSWNTYNPELVTNYNWKANFNINSNISSTNWATYIKNLIASGHEITNHTLSHISWINYFNSGKTPEEFYDEEIYPQCMNIFTVFGIIPTTFAYAQDYGTYTPLNNWLIENANEITRIRPCVSNISEIESCRIRPDNSSIIVPAIGFELFNDNNITDILAEIDNAKNNNYIINMYGHTIHATNNTGLEISIDNVRAICNRVVTNGMKFYKFSELPYNP